MTDIFTYLSSLSYPGRGIFMGKSEDSSKAVCAYFIMGRSEHSRNRVFTTDGTDVRTEAINKCLVRDPSLIIYTPVRSIGNKLVITNGDHTDTICKYLLGGSDYTAALRTRDFEPDAHNYTPRISAVMEFGRSDITYAMSMLKANGSDGTFTDRYFYEYGRANAGEGRLIHTYENNGDPLPSFIGEPRQLSISGDIEAFADRLWDSLNADNRISLFVRYIDIASHAQESRIINKLGGCDSEW